ncbi:DNA topoisomerase III [Dickeya oryzae]|uniref:DNA topoisomerase n=1 Tax=Dickeya oryzae TaxID=1240404 RepID=A0AB39IPV7_9GAMM|nr:DNA topoisomerase III [Dickeya oryzae]MCA6990834.1 DNA topoisomerase III [Dickeya oryzae]
MRLFLCEKPSQGRDIAAVLGASKRGQGFLSGPDTVVTWAVGHLLENASPEMYGEQYGQPWRLDVLPLLPRQWQMVVKKDTADQFAVITRLLKQSDEVVIATDADREGEVIARELLEYCRFNGVVSRLWLSALDEASVRKALANIRPGNSTENLYYAGLGRGRADWLIGMNISRLYTLKARELGYDGVLSAGRVQTPTLALVVRRDRQIATFVPKPYFQVHVKLESGGVMFPAEWVAAAAYTDGEKRCINQAVAEQVRQLCLTVGKAVILDVEKKREKIPAPLAFSQGELQKVCADRFGYSPQKVLDITQALYETHKATSYPRTDCGYLPESMLSEVPHVLSALQQSDPSLAPVIDSIDPSFRSRIWDDKKITAHHAIIPTPHKCNLAGMNEAERNVYTLIRTHYLAQFMPLLEMDVTRASFNIGGQLFRTSGRVTVVPGWKTLFGQAAVSDSDERDDEAAAVSLPPLTKDAVCGIRGAELKALKTKPPQPYSFKTLIAAMMNAAGLVDDPALKKVLRDNAGLGTEATRAGILDVLMKRGFLIKKGNHLHASDTACDLVDALPAALTQVGMTALWEQALDDIAAGKMTLDSFVDRQLRWVNQLVEQGKQQAFTIRIPERPKCPLCGGRTRLRKGPGGTFYGCENYPTCKGIVDSGANNKRRNRSGSSKSFNKKQN